jgi:hypothetical protein
MTVGYSKHTICSVFLSTVKFQPIPVEMDNKCIHVGDLYGCSTYVEALSCSYYHREF